MGNDNAKNKKTVKSPVDNFIETGEFFPDKPDEIVADDETGFIIDGTDLCGYVPLPDEKTVTVPEGVDYLCDNTFDGCSSLKKVTLPKSLKTIDAWVFQDCENLKEINIPDGIRFIDEEAFDFCEDIQATYKGKTYDYAHIDELYKAVNNR